MKKMTKTALMSALWLLNPVIGCSDGFEFDESDLIALMDGVAETTWVSEQEAIEYEIHFQLEKGDIDYDEDSEDYSDDAFGSLISTVDIFASAHACGTRSFLSEAEACIDTTILSVKGTVEIIEVSSQEVVLEEAVDGAISVWGKHLNEADFWLKGETSDFSLYSSDGISFELNEVTW